VSTTSAPCGDAGKSRDVRRRQAANPKLSDRKKGELRYGSKGSLSIDLNNARWYDHETSEGGNATESRTRQVRPRASALPRAGDVGSTAAPHNGCS